MKKVCLFILMLLSFNILFAQWQKTNAPDINSINSIALKGDSIFAGADYMYLSTDKGANWNTLFNGLQSTSFYNSVLIKGNHIYVGTYNGLYVSTDNAGTFSLVDNCSCTNANLVLLHGNDIYVVTSGSGKGIFRSLDNGLSWAKISNNLPLDVNNIYCLSFLGTAILIGSDAGFLISNNDGVTWAPMNSGLPGYMVHSINVIGNVIFAGTENGVYRSTDNAATWTSVSTGLPNDYWVGTILTLGNKLIIGGPYGGGCYFSDNYGDTWIDSSDGLSSMQTLAFAYNSDTMYVGTGAVSGFYTGGLYKRALTELVSVNEIERENGIHIFPNPASDKINIEMPEESGKTLITISNISGQELFSDNYSQNSFFIDISKFSAGLYLLKIASESNIQVLKIIRQ